jgi:hypothetical protein
MHLILHIGAGRCGSSSLQTLLSQQPFWTADDASQRYEYVCILPDGNLLRGAHLRRTAKSFPEGFCVSVGAEAAFAGDEAVLVRLSGQLRSMIDDGITPIASWEGWLTQPHFFAKHDVFRRLGVAAKLIAFVRPQLPWLNSAWWQWGAWSGQEFRQWVEASRPKARWATLLASWREVPGVASLETHMARRDVVKTLFASLGVSPPELARRNKGEDPVVLRLLQNAPDHIRSRRSSLGFVLERWLPELGKNGAPWVFTPDDAAALIEGYRADNERLLNLVSPEAKRDMLAEPEWWDANTFANRRVSSAYGAGPSADELGDFAKRALRAIAKLDERVRSLELRELTMQEPQPPSEPGPTRGPQRHAPSAWNSPGSGGQ